MINAVPGKAATALSLHNRLQLHDKPRMSVSVAVNLSASTTKKEQEKGRETAEKANDFVVSFSSVCQFQSGRERGCDRDGQDRTVDFVVSFSSTCQFQEGREAVIETDRTGLSTSSSVSAQLANFSAKLSRSSQTRGCQTVSVSAESLVLFSN